MILTYFNIFIEGMSLKYAPIAYKGVLVSFSPRKVPCAASAMTIGGAPKALIVRNSSAGWRIGESYNITHAFVIYKRFKMLIGKGRARGVQDRNTIITNIQRSERHEQTAYACNCLKIELNNNVKEELPS